MKIRILIVLVVSLSCFSTSGEPDSDETNPTPLSTMVPDSARRGSMPRRDERVAKADEAALRGQRLAADKDWPEATREFKKALDLLPNAPVVQSRRDEYSAYLHDSNLMAIQIDLGAGRFSIALERLRESGCFWLAEHFIELREEPAMEARYLVSTTHAMPIFGMFLLLGTLAGVIRFQPTRRLRLPFYLLPFAIPATAFVIIVVAASLGYLQPSSPMLDILGGALLMFLLVCSAASVPYLIGKIAGLRWRLHRFRNSNTETPIQ